MFFFMYKNYGYVIELFYFAIANKLSFDVELDKSISISMVNLVY